MPLLDWQHSNQGWRPTNVWAQNYGLPGFSSTHEFWVPKTVLLGNPKVTESRVAVANKSTGDKYGADFLVGILLIISLIFVTQLPIVSMPSNHEASMVILVAGFVYGSYRILKGLVRMFD